VAIFFKAGLQTKAEFYVLGENCFIVDLPYSSMQVWLECKAYR